jgi:nicotinamide-nucleotide amidase
MSLFRSCWLALLLPATAGGPLAAGASPPETGRQPVDYVIIVTGGELLLGAYPDGHTYFLTRTLRPLGLHCVGSMSVDDKRDAIREALGFATAKAALVIVTGGLGPTDNDVTRETLSDFTGIALEEHPDVLAAMERRFGLPRDQIRPNLRQQTQVPTRGTYLKNPNGTAVGLVFEPRDVVIVALPGPPRELQAMVRDELVPYLSRRFGTRLPGCSLLLRFVGLGQSQVDQTLHEHVPLAPDVTLSSQFEGGRVDFTFSLPDDNPQDRQRLEQLEQKILAHLGDYVYADDETSLEQHVVDLLAARDATLALAEVASGGGLAAGLNETDGAGRVLAGAYVAPTEEKLRRLLDVADDQWGRSVSSEQRAGLLAQAAADVTGSQWAIAVGQAAEGQGGARYVEAVFRPPDGRLEGRRLRLRGDGELSRFRLTTQILDQLRRRLRGVVSDE